MNKFLLRIRKHVKQIIFLLQLCKRGRVHIFKYLENEAIKLDKKAGMTGSGTLSRRTRRNGAGSSPGPPTHLDKLKSKRQNVDSGYSTSSDGFDKRWSQDLAGILPSNICLLKT